MSVKTIIDCKDVAKIAKVLENEMNKNVNQVKFAAMKSLNSVAFKARENLISEYKESFIVRNTNLPKAVSIKKATKENLTAEVLFPKDWMYINTKGGKKEPEQSKVLMVPLKNGDLKDFRMSSGKIKQSKKPGALLKYADAHPKKTKGHVANPHPFLLSNKKGQPLIAVRDTYDRSRMKWLYVGVPVAEVKKRWDFEQIVHETAEKELPKEFEKQLKHALETAK
jgi:hypothetical protein